jgi:hypothetical protein
MSRLGFGLTLQTVCAVVDLMTNTDAVASDLDGSCCEDIEKRISEFEATKED